MVSFPCSCLGGCNTGDGADKNLLKGCHASEPVGCN